jgi:hypothetical protein
MKVDLKYDKFTFSWTDTGDIQVTLSLNGKPAIQFIIDDVDADNFVNSLKRARKLARRAKRG